MAVRHRRAQDEAEQPLFRNGTKLRLADESFHTTPSPARQRQHLLEARWTLDEAVELDPRRWSHRRTLAFIGLTCGGFWTCVAVGAAQLLR